MKNIPKITAAEYEIMKILWDNYPLTANKIIETLSSKTHWTSKTVRTLINRLVKKKAIKYEQDGKSYLYSPAVCRSECVAEESASFLNRMFDGALMPMLTHFVKSKKLKPEDIEKLKSILESGED
ncbi:MAG: transcriptional regulator [Lentisphaerae bacterium GWF2_44_16]|nr:MAG: transcriptional regulator [Lentisphaerae bacterium GWF2_44_16]